LGPSIYWKNAKQKAGSQYGLGGLAGEHLGLFEQGVDSVGETIISCFRSISLDYARI
jgi:hypothetical protein